MQEYNVAWEVTQEGLSPIDAVIQVANSYFQERIAQGHPGTACVFLVTEVGGKQTEVALDAEISRLDAAQLRQVFENEHPVHTLDNWRAEVQFGDTILGYWEHVQHKLEQESHEAQN